MVLKLGLLQFLEGLFLKLRHLELFQAHFRLLGGVLGRREGRRRLIHLSLKDELELLGGLFRA